MCARWSRWSCAWWPRPPPAQTLVEHYVAAMQARGEEDYATYLSEMEAALEIEPGHPVIQFHLARACANTAEPEHAIDWLGRAFMQGAWLDIGIDPWLEPLHDHTEWPSMLALAGRTGAHQGRGVAGFELEEFDLLPEGIEHDPVSDLFLLGSAKRKIITVSRDGSTTEFVAPRQDGLLVPLGLRVDAERRRLWAVSVGDPVMVRSRRTRTGALRCTAGRWTTAPCSGAGLRRRTLLRTVSMTSRCTPTAAWS